jgi:hypothetical protein
MKKTILFIFSSIIFAQTGFTQWRSANIGINTGSIKSLIVDPSTNYIYAGTESGGV